jgi:hypothetical protein
MMAPYDKILSIINKKYRVLDTIDLVDARIQETLGQRLQAFKDCTFSENERLIVLVDKSLPTTFAGHAPDILPKLQEYIRNANIAHAFILIITNIDNLDKHLLHLQQTRYPQETIPIPCLKSKA